MRDIAIEVLDRYRDEAAYAAEADGVYRDLTDPTATPYRLAVSFVAEEGEGQYPLEDLLDQYLLHVSDQLTAAAAPWQPGTRLTIEFGGELDALRRATDIAGKRVYNQLVTEDGREFVRTVTE